MDNARPALDLKHFENICPDKNSKSVSKYSLWTGTDMGDFQVPVIAVFTKFDQFKCNIQIALMEEDPDQETDITAEAENKFNQYYLASLKGDPPYIRLESEDVIIR